MNPKMRSSNFHDLSNILIVVAVFVFVPSLKSQSLLGYYPFEGDHDDVSGNDNAAVPTQNTNQISFTDGFRGRGADINDPAANGGGNTGGTINIPINANPDVLEEVSFGGWVNLETAEGFPGFMAIDNGGWDRGISLHNLQWSIASGGNTNSGIAPTPGSWEYVVGTFSKPKNRAILYVGDADADTATTTSISRSDGGNAPGELEIEIGRYDNQDLDAVVDDIFVFSGELSAHQVNAIRNLRLSDLDYSPAQAAELFTLFDDNDAGEIAGITWSPVSGLDPENPGVLSDLGDEGISLVLDDLGNGMAGFVQFGLDADNDGIPDFWEEKHDVDDPDEDPDNDGLTNIDEYESRTDPKLADTDEDELSDGDEINVHNTNPLDQDSDNDGLDDGFEVTAGTNPLESDTDGDGYADEIEITRGTDPTDPDINPGNITPKPPPKPLFVPSIPVTARDSVVVFNEIHYHPADDDSSLEYVELYNQMAVDVDLSNWHIGGIDYNFPEGTVLGGRDYLVIAKDPEALQAVTGYSGALGPFAGTLSNSGENLRLFTHNRAFRNSSGGDGSKGEVSSLLDGRRIMDEINFTDTYPWPVGPDGSGSTLNKRDPMTGTPHPIHWESSQRKNGSPGKKNELSAVPAIAFNELTGTTEDNFQVELYNFGNTPISLGGMVIGSSDPVQEDYIFPVTSLAVGAYITIDAVTLGYNLDDNSRLFLYSVGRVALIDAVRVDDRPLARSPEGTGRWLRPDTLTLGSENSFSFNDDIIINEIFYHAYPQRESPGTPPALVNVTVLDFDASWRFEEDAGESGLPAGWEDVFHPDWPSGPGLIAQETSALNEPIRTDINLAPPTVTYYFETEFNHVGGAVDELIVQHYVDDGAVFYLNGVEIERFNMPGGTVTPTTLASPGVTNATVNSFILVNPNVVSGSNRISVEVHQSSSGSSDIVFGARVIVGTFTPSGNPPIPYALRDEEWVELFNRGPMPVNLTNWKLDGGINFNFPDGTMIGEREYLVIAKDAVALAGKHPTAKIIGNYSNRLGNGGDLIVLKDPVGNPADEVVYYDSGHWHAAADGGGSSLELCDPESDNTVAESWAPSDETNRSDWKIYSYEGIAESDGQGNNVYHEFLLGLLDAGELLLDDVSVIEDPGGTNIEFIKNGDFEGDGLGSEPDKWRCIGTHGSHGRTVVVDDPDESGNRCLHVVSTGPTEDKHNKIETTFANNERVVLGQTYRITFRAKWLTGSNQVNTRLYFSYLQRTNLLEVPEVWGTPGASNSTLVVNSGPSVTGLRHVPVVPEANQSVSVFAKVDDPDGVADVILFYSVNGGAFRSRVMSERGAGIYSGTVPGQSAKRIVRFYLHCQDNAGAISFHPPQGAESGAFYKVQDNLADLSGLRHNFRIIMDNDDRSFLFRNTNRMSNDRFPVTVIEDEQTVYYDARLRLKASGFGRYSSGHYGFNMEFQPDRLFRGVHKTISVERSSGLKEIMAKHLTNRAGGAYSSFYDDVAYIINPNPGHQGPGLLAMTRHTKRFFNGLFPDSGDGTLFNLELLYNPNGTTGGAEGLKINNPYNHTGGIYELRDRGDDKEPYRWGYQIRSARGRDDYSRIVALNQTVGNLRGVELKTSLDELIDVDQWMRSFAMFSLNGNDDTYGRIWPHNFRFYVRPTDQKIMIFQWDLDRAFNLSTSASVTPGNNISRLFSIPEYRRLFNGHLLDLAETTFNSTYVTPWASHLSMLTGSGLTGLRGYVQDRANFVLRSLPAAIPFAITTNGGGDFSIANTVSNLAGDGWIDVHTIEINGQPAILNWTDANSWKTDTHLAPGANAITLTARNFRGTIVGSDSIIITNTSGTDLASASNSVITEIHYHPTDPNQAEINAGFINSDEFEFVEVTNISTKPVDYTGASLSEAADFRFPNNTVLGPGQRAIIVTNRAAFVFRYGVRERSILGEYSGKFNNAGEQLIFKAADASIIADISYSDDAPWPTSSDGEGYSLIRLYPNKTTFDLNDPRNWSSSRDIGGDPGNGDSYTVEHWLAEHSLAPEVDLLVDTDTDGLVNLLEYAIDVDPNSAEENIMPLVTIEPIEVDGVIKDYLVFQYRRHIGVMDILFTPRVSSGDLKWSSSSEDIVYIDTRNNGNGSATMRFRSVIPFTDNSREFFSLRIEKVLDE